MYRQANTTQRFKTSGKDTLALPEKAESRAGRPYSTLVSQNDASELYENTQSHRNNEIGHKHSTASHCASLSVGVATIKPEEGTKIEEKAGTPRQESSGKSSEKLAEKPISQFTVANTADLLTNSGAWMDESDDRKDNLPTEMVIVEGAADLAH